MCFWINFCVCCWLLQENVSGSGGMLCVRRYRFYDSWSERWFFCPFPQYFRLCSFPLALYRITFPHSFHYVRHFSWYAAMHVLTVIVALCFFSSSMRRTYILDFIFEFFASMKKLKAQTSLIGPSETEKPENNSVFKQKIMFRNRFVSQAILILLFL